MVRVTSALACASLCMSGSAASAAAQLYVADNSGNSVVSIDTVANEIVGTPITVGANPLAPVASANGLRVYVQSAVDATISAIDTRTRSVVATFADAHPSGAPQALAVSPDGARLFVAETGSIAILDTRSGARSATVAAPAAAAKDSALIAASIDGKRVYVAYREHRTVAAIDIAQNKIVALAVSSNGPSAPLAGLALSADGTTLYVNDSSGTLYALDAATLDTVSTQPYAIPLRASTLSPDGKKLYAAADTAACLFALDVGSGVSSGVGVQANHCQDIAISGDGKTLYLSSLGADGNWNLLALDAASLTSKSNALGGLGHPVFGSQSIVAATIIPETGLWWNPNESGRGFEIELQGDSLVVIANSYDAQGIAHWYYSAGAYDALSGTFAATLDSTSGGQCLGCTYRAPTSTRGAGGTIGITFFTPTTGALFFDGGYTPIQKQTW